MSRPLLATKADSRCGTLLSATVGRPTCGGKRIFWKAQRKAAKLELRKE
jgi:hypothetical protein